jgi:hypothetical protein
MTHPINPVALGAHYQRRRESRAGLPDLFTAAVCDAWAQISENRQLPGRYAPTMLALVSVPMGSVVWLRTALAPLLPDAVLDSAVFQMHRDAQKLLLDISGPADGPPPFEALDGDARQVARCLAYWGQEGDRA